MKTYGEEQARLIRDSRQRKGVSQKDLDTILGGSYKTRGQLVSNIERCKCGLPPKHLMKVCSTLEIPVGDMIDAMVSDFRARLWGVTNGQM
jgi:ribosome-binding protein aMBF1 (putative translation factor)